MLPTLNKIELKNIKVDFHKAFKGNSTLSKCIFPFKVFKFITGKNQWAAEWRHEKVDKSLYNLPLECFDIFKDNLCRQGCSLLLFIKPIIHPKYLLTTLNLKIQETSQIFICFDCFHLSLNLLLYSFKQTTFILFQKLWTTCKSFLKCQTSYFEP